MPVRRARPITTGRRLPRRRLTWVTAVLSPTALASSTAAAAQDLLVLAETPGVGFIGGTILRTHLVLSAVWAASDTGPAVDIGLIVDDAPASTAIDPAAVASYHFDWMLWKFLPLASGISSMVSGSNVITAWDIDLRAKRRIRNMNDKYFFCLNNRGSTTLTYSLAARILIALP